MKYSRVHRLLRVLTLVQSGRGWDAQRLAQACGTTIRTIYRDLNMLEGAGIPYFFDEDSDSYRVRGDFFMPPVELTMEEALAILCLAESVGTQEQIPFMRPAARAAAKVRGQLPATIRDSLEKVGPHVEIRLAQAVPPDGVADVYEVVRLAIARRKALRCSYESPRHRSGPKQPSVESDGAARHSDQPTDEHHCGRADNEEMFIFRPYCLFFSQRAWYAVGGHSGRRGLRCLKLNRFTSVTLTDQAYVIPNDFSLKSYLGKAWRMIRGERVYRVELEFDAAFADTVAETHWHDTQEIEWLDDGSILFRCEVAGLDEIVWWILSMGPHCVVRRPIELAERVQQLARETVRKYDQGPRRSARARGGRRLAVANRS
jgi:proteasome accessory factor B